jgi:hypothetical protein
MSGTAYSVQQIKFECLSYIKEFGSRGADWIGGTCADPRQTLFALHAVDEERDIWCWKPALSPAAARTVAAFLQQRIGVRKPEPQEEGACVFLFKKVAET